MNSCASSVVSPVRWVPQEEGITLHLYANKKLHNETGTPGPLDITVYQLKNPVAFNKLIADEKGRHKMLQSKKFDSSVACVEKIKISPGSQASYAFDRAEGASHVGIVAAYNSMEKKTSTRLYNIPVFVKKEKIFSSGRKLVPGKLNIKVGLGNDRIKNREVKAHIGASIEKEMK